MKISHSSLFLGICTLATQAASQLTSRTSTDSKILALTTQIGSYSTSETPSDFSALVIDKELWPEISYIWGKYSKSAMCIDKSDSDCTEPLEKSFAYFLNNKPFAASLLAQDCIGKNNSECKKIVHEALPKLLEKSHEHAFSFMTAYLKNGNNAEKINEHFENAATQRLSPASVDLPLIIVDHNSPSIIIEISSYLLDIQSAIAKNFLLACEGKDDFTCKTFFLQSFSLLTKNSDAAVLELPEV